MARGLLIWLLIMLVETIHGVLRAALVVPRLGATAAERIGWPVAAVLVMGIALLTIKWTGLHARRSLLGLGAAWAVLTVLFELAIGVLRGLDAAALMAALDPLNGSVPWSAALMLVTPLVAARLRGIAR
jgi:hypothetical protein